MSQFVYNQEEQERHIRSLDPNAALVHSAILRQDSAMAPWSFLEWHSLRGRWQEGEKSKIFWQALCTLWSSFDVIPYKPYQRLLRRHRPAFKPDYMGPWDRQFYESLPEELTVYRGQDLYRQAVGLSWTLDREVASGFAKGHRGMLNTAPVIMQATVRKSDIAFVQCDRSESEIILYRVPRDPLVDIM